MTRVRLRRIFWVGAAAVLVTAALIALAAVVRGELTDNDGRILVTLAALLYAGAAALAGLAVVDQGRARPLGWMVALAAPVSLALVSWAIWSFAFDESGGGTRDELAWSSVVLLLAGLMATTALLVARTVQTTRLAGGAGALAALAALLSVAAILTDAGDTWAKVVAAAWILAALAYFLVPVLQRFTSAGVEGGAGERILAELDGIELVATRSGSGLEPRLERGEHLLLRRR